ncbi:MAG: hypothetical protein ACR2FX_01795 [Chthoniobacterales bacterium]
MLQFKKDMGWYKRLGRGEPVQVNAGQSYPLDIITGEWPGGDFKVFLLLEKDGVNYDKDSKGNPILRRSRVSTLPGNSEPAGAGLPDQTRDWFARRGVHTRRGVTAECYREVSPQMNADFHR